MKTIQPGEVGFFSELPMWSIFLFMDTPDDVEYNPCFQKNCTNSAYFADDNQVGGWMIKNKVKAGIDRNEEVLCVALFNGRLPFKS